MSTEYLSSNGRVEPRSFWFGVGGSAVSWIVLGCADVAITFIACTHQESFGVAGPHPNVIALFAAVTVVLLGTTIAAGVLSYRNWRKFSARPNVLDTLAVEHREFLALIGVIVSITLGMGIIWLALPPLFLDICWRAR